MVGCSFAEAAILAEVGEVVYVSFAPEQILLPDFYGGYRPAGEYNGYTYIHLPNCPKNTDAIPASFAARIAFSSLWIRWLLR